MTSDLSRSQYPTRFFTIRVHNFKDDPHAENLTLHGLFTDPREAALVASQIGDEAYPDFLTAEVIPVQFGTVAQVAQAQDIGWVPGTPERDTPPAPPGSYTNPTPESIAAEVAAEAALREEMRAEDEAEELERARRLVARADGVEDVPWADDVLYRAEHGDDEGREQ